METIKNLIPKSLKNHVKLLKNKKRFPNRQIDTHLIGKNVTLGEKVGLSEDVDIRDNVIIGNYSYINKGSMITSGKIGNFVSIGFNCQIGGYNHPIEHISTSPYFYQKSRSILGTDDLWDELQKPPFIGDDVWIASNVIILQGVTVGNGAVIAAGAVVTKDVAPYSIVAGVPAQEIKKRFTEKEIQKLNELNWTNKDTEQLKQLKLLFLAKERWLDKC